VNVAATLPWPRNKYPLNSPGDVCNDVSLSEVTYFNCTRGHGQNFDIGDFDWRCDPIAIEENEKNGPTRMTGNIENCAVTCPARLQ